MAVLTALDQADARTLCAAYDLPDPLEIQGIAGGSVNSNFAFLLGEGAVRDRVFCRLYEEQDLDGARREAAMLDRLSRGGVPTPAPLRLADAGDPGSSGAETGAAFVTTVRGKPAALFPWRVGTIRCQASVTPQDAGRVGEALARVHEAGRAEEAHPGRFGFPQLLARLEGVGQSGDARFAPLAPALRAHLERVQGARDPELPSGLIHGDLFRDNVLWCASELSALLDFESACRGTYAYDLAVTVLSWCYGDDLEPALVRAMVAGYERQRRLTPSERRGIHAEAMFAALRFTVTRITDYAMRSGAAGPRVVKDWSRFMKRFERLEALGPAGFEALLFP